MIPAPITCLSMNSTNSTTGGTSAASMTSTSRKAELGGWGRAFGSVRVVMLGCSAAAPQAA
jgi:hypothetical protein